MDSNILELLQDLRTRLTNIVRTGVITEVDRGKVRVQTGGIITKYLPYVTQRAGDCITWWKPSLGEQVMILSPCGNINNGIVINSIYTAIQEPPEDFDKKHQTRYPDGTIITYDYENKKLQIESEAEIVIRSSKITIDAGTQEIDITASKLNINAETNISNKLNVANDITSTTDVKAQNKSLVSHNHIDAEGRATSPTR
ncbi:phage baseplate assembly protein V [Francisella hispaniensis]|uniref:Baseplate assembly protein V n=1 Tax=Francisella hispaniensis TaxID=622488 RepID=F4BFQ6_9GAMM|nr:phage baseplate assembly protein V [Francisella hispaniensis]AEE26300.1 baseplate assembly protein V [Francisella hispaniensis]